MSWHRVQHTPSTAYTEYSMHQVQHTPSTAYTEYHIHRVQHLPKILCLPCILMITSWPLNGTSGSGLRRYLIDCHQTSSPWELKPKVTLSQSHCCEITNWWKEFQYPARHPLTASRYVSKYARLWPPSSHNHGLQVHLWTCSITASKCISKLAQSQPPNSINRSLQVHISKHVRFRHRSASPNLLDDSLHTCSIVASKCISKYARLLPPRCIALLTWWWTQSVYPSSLDRHFQAHFKLLSSTTGSHSPDISFVDG